ncbi:YycH family regulatory protein [Marinilactibacillus kalidii]|uniref:YycH family regulatory protein n=1 Tax=Marinilactibacillus kalidii TaxID=2820274 RepID=UPI001ABDC837|nr:two-component system activity regulator YycH [Marinilactibacillus kalidii]
MTWTHMKHALLTFLIILSLFLSYNLILTGTQSNTSSSSGNTQAPVLIDRTLSEVFSPNQVVLHEAFSDPQIASMAEAEALINTSYANMTFRGVESPEPFTKANYQQLLQGDDWVEFVFNAQIPFGLFENGFEDLPSDYEDRTFSRVLFNLNEPNWVLFYNMNEEIVYGIQDVTITNDVIEAFRDSEEIAYTPAEALDLGQIVYVPKEAVTVPYRNYLVESLPNSLYTNMFFVDTPFSDPANNSEEWRYYDYTQEVTINDKLHVLTYFSERTNLDEITLSERLSGSFEELNRVENWTEKSQYQAYDPETHEATFQRYLEGLPVFSPEQYETTTLVTYVKAGVKKLQVPLRIIQTPITSDEFTEKKLESGQELVSRLKAIGVEASKIEDLEIGLTWKENEEEPRLINYEPAWYVKLVGDSQWYDADRYIELQGEEFNGL